MSNFLHIYICEKLHNIYKYTEKDIREQNKEVQAVYVDFNSSRGLRLYK